MRPQGAAGRAGWAALRAEPGRALIAVDYDGTLAPIVPDPARAVAAAGAADVLAALAGRVGQVAVVTGRPAQVAVDLGGLGAVPGLVVLGQYGVERWSGGHVVAAEPLPGVAAARRSLRDLPAGVALEDKGHSLVVHVRGAADPARAQAELEPRVREVALANGLEVHPGRMVLELRPPGHDKRGALQSLCEPPPSVVVFAGDDLGDLPAFDAVDALRAAGVPGLLVCSASAEGPAALRERADIVVDAPEGVVALLATMLRELA